jgi:hypothetical protein
VIGLLSQEADSLRLREQDYRAMEGQVRELERQSQIVMQETAQISN